MVLLQAGRSNARWMMMAPESLREDDPEPWEEKGFVGFLFFWRESAGEAPTPIFILYEKEYLHSTRPKAQRKRKQL
jgi:hypothetical protein